MSPLGRRWTRIVDGKLLFAIGVDVSLSLMTALAPQWWFQTFHGVQGDALAVLFLQRCGANWTAFALFQILAVARWRRSTVWLPIIAGVRFSDVFTDWTYLAVSPHTEIIGVPAFLLPAAMNWGMALLLLAAWQRLRVQPG